MKTLVVGSTGFIANHLIPALKRTEREILTADRTGGENIIEIDLTDLEGFNYTRLSEIDEVIFLAAISSPDMCSNQYEAAYKINVTNTIKFITQAIEHKCKILFFSSDAVFGMGDNKVFFDESKTHPNTPYGKMKKEVEDTFKTNKLFKAIRLSYVLSDKDKFTQYWRACYDNQDIIEVFHPFYRNCIWLTEVIEGCINLLDKWDEIPSTLINFGGNQLISRLEIIDQYNRILEKKAEYRIVLGNEDFFLNRPRIAEIKSKYATLLITNYNLSFIDKINLYTKGE